MPASGALTGAALGSGGDDAGRAHGDDPAAGLAAVGAQVDHPVGRGDDVELVLDHHDGVAQVGQSVEDLEQAVDVGEMQAGGRLVEDIKRPGRSAGRPSSAASLMRWASPPESVRARLAERQVSQPDVVQRIEALRALAAPRRRAAGSRRRASPARRRSTCP